MANPALPRAARLALLVLLERDGFNPYRRTRELADLFGVHVRSIQRDVRESRAVVRELERLEALWREVVQDGGKGRMCYDGAADRTNGKSPGS